MNDFPVSLGTLSSNVVFELLDPCLSFFPRAALAMANIHTGEEQNLLLRIKHISEKDTTASLVDTNR